MFTYIAKGVGINSSLGTEKIKVEFGSNYDIAKNEYEQSRVVSRAISELKKYWATDSVRLKSVIKKEREFKC